MAGTDPGAASRSPLGSIRDYAVAPSEAVGFDETDLRLLLLLSKDARLSQRALARELGMSAPAVGDRIARLERQGVISGYAARLNWSALGYPTTVYLTVVAVLDYEQGLIMQALAEIPEVEEIMLVTGDVDLLVRVRVRDYTHLRSLLLNQVWQIEGIQRTETSMTIAEMPTPDTAVRLLTDMADLARQKANPTAPR
ncbi:MAG TPA: Lrp/AsnC family transcriptional regulator [Jatrophihabitantaceae bacterium]|nr:Lrp/AsnC family transcriptional regulator [Jatrophihabitantaceae bacterium]